ncbi:thioesterase II family protein [Nonomuraea sp. NPDC003707]
MVWPHLKRYFMDSSKITIVRYQRASNAELRLLCFPHIAGGPASFNSWRRHIGAEVELCVPLLPGREQAFNRSAFVEIDPLLEALETAIEPLLDMPMVFFGDCLGAMVAGLTANVLESRGNRSIEKVILRSLPYSPNGLRIPGLPASTAKLDELAEYLRNVGKTNLKLLDDPDWVDVITEPLRADLALTESLRDRSVDPMSAPLTVIADRKDSDDVRTYTGWSDLTRSDFTLRIQEGRLLSKDELWRRLARIVDDEVRGLLT